MVKGMSRRVVVVEAPDQRFFEQAIFILRNDAAKDGISSREIVEEARQVAQSYTSGARRPFRRRPAVLWSLGGAALVGLLWLLVTLYG